MKKMNKLAVYALSGAMIFGLTACGGGGAKLSPAEAVTAANEKMAELDSYHAEMIMDMDMTLSMMGQEMTMATETLTSADTFMNPMKAAMNMTMTMDMGEAMGEPTEMFMDIYMADIDGTYMLYSPDFGSAPIDTAMMEQMDPANSMNVYIESGDSFVEEGVETLDSGEATKYTGVITGDAMEDVLVQSGMMDSLNSLGLSEEGIDFAAIYENLGDMTVSIWVDEEGYPVRYDMDMTEMMDAILGNILSSVEDAEDGTMTVDKAFVTMTLTNLNAVEDFELPAEMTAE